MAPNAEEASFSNDLHSGRRSVFRRLFYVSSVLPLVWLACLYAFVMRARLILGTWPSLESGPARHHLGFSIHERLVSGGMIFLPIWFVVWCLLTTPASVSSRRFVALLCLWGLPVAIAALDPGRFFRWYVLYSD